MKGFYCSLYTLRMPDQFSTVTEPKDAAGNEHKVIDSFAYDRHPTVKNFVHGSRVSFSTSTGASSVCPTKTNTETRTTTKTETQTSISTAVSIDYVTATLVREHTVTVTVAPSGHLTPRDGADKFVASNIRNIAGQPIEAEATPTGFVEMLEAVVALAAEVQDASASVVEAKATPTTVAEMFDAAVDEVLASAVALAEELQDAAASGVGAKDAPALSWKSWRSMFIGDKRADGDDDDSEEGVVASDTGKGDEDVWVE